MKPAPTAPCAVRKGCDQAFTLIELLVVITIIVILLALLTPALDKAIGEAEAVACAANMRNVGQAIKLYALDRKRALPNSMRFSVVRPNDNNGQDYNPHSWHLDKEERIGIEPRDGTEVTEQTGVERQPYPGGEIWEYVRNEKTFACPTFSGLQYDNHFADGNALGYQHDPVERQIGSAFVMHRAIRPGNSGFQQGLRITRLAGKWASNSSESKSLVPSATLMLTEESIVPHAWANNPRDDTAIAINRNPNIAPNQFDGLANYHPDTFGGDNNGSANVTFFDGHIERVPPNRGQEVAWPGVGWN